MEFEGGYTTPDNPLGWKLITAGGQLVTSGDFEAAWQITGAGLSPFGALQQWIKSDPDGNAIIKPSTRYIFRAWIKAQDVGQAGDIFVQMLDDANTVYGLAQIPIASASQTGTFLEAEVDNPTPAAIPSSLYLTFFASHMDV